MEQQDMTTTPDKLREIVRQAGVPDNAITTTLIKENAPRVRQFIKDEGYKRDNGYNGFYVYPHQIKYSNRARLVFYTIAKELVLSGVSCYCLSLSRLCNALTDEDNPTDYDRINQVEMVFVSDFYEHGIAMPFSGWQSARMRSWVKDKFEQGGAVSLLGDTALPDTVSWWPPSFTGFISYYTQTFPIG